MSLFDVLAILYAGGVVFTASTLLRSDYQHLLTAALTVTALSCVWPLFWTAASVDQWLGER